MRSLRWEPASALPWRPENHDRHECPGFSLMQEHIGMAVMAEVPVVIVNVMRGGPSTGMPTKPAKPI